MTDIELLTKIDKKLDKLLTLTTKIGKALHLVPVTEKEEKAIQLLQRSNLAQAAKINDELNDMENKTDSSSYGLSDIFSETEAEVYSDIIGTDFIQKDGK